MTAQEWYQKGNEYRKMLDEIMAFYCKDMYNP